MNMTQHKLKIYIIAGFVYILLIIRHGMDLKVAAVGPIISYFSVEFMYCYLMKLPINISGGPIEYIKDNQGNQFLRLFVFLVMATFLSIFFIVESK